MTRRIVTTDASPRRRGGMRAYGAVAAAIMTVAALVPSAPLRAGTMETPMLDPWVPPTLRKAAPVVPPASGDALKAQVERNLRAAFDAADVDKAGALTREQARAAGLGYIEKNFDAMDEGGTGRVRFDDVKRFLRARGAPL